MMLPIACRSMEDRARTHAYPQDAIFRPFSFQPPPPSPSLGLLEEMPPSTTPSSGGAERAAVTRSEIGPRTCHGSGAGIPMSVDSCRRNLHG